MATHQTTGYVTQQIPCPKCGKIRSRKGKHQILLRTLFGKLRLVVIALPLRMLQQGGLPQLQSACRVTDGANDARVVLPGKQVCGPDILRIDGGAAGRHVAHKTFGVHSSNGQGGYLHLEIAHAGRLFMRDY
jgi:hypothetical protein